MSHVFLSYDVAAQSSVAVKVLADHLAHSREFVGRFYREARLSRLLAHPNLVRGLGAGLDPKVGKHYVVLEFIDGPTAQHLLGEYGRFSIGSAVRIGIDIAQALAFLHSRQYVHRDVKPDNILLHPDGLAKLADLGLAKRLNDEPQITSTHHGVGTSYYMAYEQALNADLVDGRSDLFALGATLYHLLTGEVPFPGATHEEVIREKEANTFLSMRERNPDIPHTLATVIETTLARDPRCRFQTAAELASALEATNLATSIPHFTPASHSSRPTTALDAPTRADFPLSLNSTSSLPASSETPSSGPANEPTAKSSRQAVSWFPVRIGLGILAVATISLGLVAMLGWRPILVPGAKARSVDEVEKAPNSIRTCDPQ